MAEASTRLPFSPQSGSTAFAQMLANIRWYGNGGDFLTIAQQSWKSPIMYRYAVPCKTNSLGINGENIDVIVPVTNAKRKKMATEAPYADVITFQLLTSSLISHMLKMPSPPMLTNATSVKSCPQPWRQRQRGILGNVSATATAIEASTVGQLHSHTMAHNPMDRRFL